VVLAVETVDDKSPRAGQLKKAGSRPRNSLSLGYEGHQSLRVSTFRFECDQADDNRGLRPVRRQDATGYSDRASGMGSISGIVWVHGAENLRTVLDVARLI
jgi:hypothetical protein